MGGPFFCSSLKTIRYSFVISLEISVRFLIMEAGASAAKRKQTFQGGHNHDAEKREITAHTGAGSYSGNAAVQRMRGDADR